MAEGRSTGVQQGRLYYSEREMLTQARAGEHVAPADVVKLLERLARYRGPVSHEPQERWHIRLADEVELRNAVVEGPLGPLLGGGCEVVRAEPREGEQEGVDSLPDGRGFTDEQVERGAVASYAFEGEERPWVEAPPSVRDHYRGNVVAILAAVENEGERAGEGSLGRSGGPCCAVAADGQREVPPSPAGSPQDPSAASVLRRTASRLRDPEYHWYGHAAVTLEHLAEKLEKDSLAEARGLASLDEGELSLLRAVIYGEGDGFTDDEVTRWRRVMQKIGFDPDGPNGF